MFDRKKCAGLIVSGIGLIRSEIEQSFPSRLSHRKDHAGGSTYSRAPADLYEIDLHWVIPKYIGETEKNLENGFKQGETATVTVFFDEADALPEERSQVKDGHDRYANVERGLVLQKMKGYQGIVILVTNLAENIDGPDFFYSVLAGLK